MKNKEHSKLFNTLKSFRLSETEKDTLKKNIIARTVDLAELREKSSVRNITPSRHQYRRVVPVLIHIYSHAQGFTRALMFAVMLAIPLLGTASAVAFKALPGDTLYPIKIHVNEKVGSLLAINKATKANREAELALLRIVEVERLAQEKKLNAEAVKVAKEQFSTHITNFDIYLTTLTKSGQEEQAHEIKNWLHKNLRTREQSLETVITQTYQSRSSNSILKNEDLVPQQLEDLKETIEAYVE